MSDIDWHGGPVWVALSSTQVIGDQTIVVPANGTLTSWSVNSYFGSSGTVKLLILRPSGANYTIVASSASETPSGAGINTFSTNLQVQQGDSFGLAGSGTSGLRLGGTSGVLNQWVSVGTTVGTALTVPSSTYTTLNALVNAQLQTGPAATTVDVDSPGTTNSGAAVSCPVHVHPVVGSDRSGIDGTVSLTLDGVAIPECQSLPVTAGDATCVTTASATGGRHIVVATYSGNASFLTGGGSTSATVKQATTTVVSAAGTLPSAPIVYSATITPPPNAVQVASVGNGLSVPITRGTVAFSVDGTPVDGCATVVPDAEAGLATCSTTAPATPPRTP